MDITVSALFDLSHTAAGAYLAGFQYPFQALAGLHEFLLAYQKTLSPETYTEVTPGVFVARTATVYPTATLLPPTVIGPDSEVRPGAFIRGDVLVGADCVVGNSTELKNAILFDKVQVPHYNYIGDSVLGYHAHFGAGALTSNVKGDGALVVIHNGEEVPTGRKKVGAMVGDYGEIGCHTVLNPGTVIGRHTRVYPLSGVRGCVPENSIYKTADEIVPQQL